MAFHKSNDKYLERTKQYDPSFNVKFYQTFLTIRPTTNNREQFGSEIGKFCIVWFLNFVMF